MTPTGSLSGSAALFRFSIQDYRWGDRTRYGIIDGRDGTVLAIRSTRVEAENELVVLNLNHDSRRPDAGVPPAPVSLGSGLPAPAARICGRCRGEFPGAADAEPVAHEDWWLCDPCREALMGPASERRGLRPAPPAVAVEASAVAG